jgi:putative transposase
MRRAIESTFASSIVFDFEQLLARFGELTCLFDAVLKIRSEAGSFAKLKNLGFGRESRAHCCPGHTIFAYLLRNRPITHSNDVWAMDTTYIPMREGFVYLTAVIDVHSRAVLAHRVATTLEASVAVEVLQAAFARYGAPNIVNTDQGSQFTAQAFVDTVKAKGCQISMDGKGAWRDNVFIERFWRTVKYERVYLTVYETVLEAKRDIAQFIDERYNTQRAHSSLEDKTPMSVYWAKLPMELKKAA